MKKKVPMICSIASAVLVIAFVIKCIVDYGRYTASFGSAPFSVWIGVNAVFMILPAVIVFAIGLIVKRRQK